MRSIISLALAAFALVAARGAVMHRWQTETSEIADETITAYHGDTVELQCKMTSYGQVIPSCRRDAEFLWQTNGMGNAWWQTNAVCSSGTVKATWTPDMDAGANEYRFFIVVSDTKGASYRANGTIELLGSPYGDARHLPLPAKVIDFAAVEVLNPTNAPWTTRDETRARIERLKAAVTDPAPVKLAPASLKAYLAELYRAVQEL